MTPPLSLDPLRTAVLSMDLHRSIVGQYARDAEGLMARVAAVQGHARTLGIRVMHARVGFRPGLPEINERNTLCASIKNNPKHAQAFAGEMGAIHPAGAPAGDEVVITKHRVSTFCGTDLEMILRANAIETLVLLGIATSGVVLATLLDAFDLDFRLAVIHDCCVDLNPEVHACLVEKVFPRYGAVLSAGEFLDAPMGTAASGG
jgi:nicotinamidase-related amidase